MLGLNLMSSQKPGVNYPAVKNWPTIWRSGFKQPWQVIRGHGQEQVTTDPYNQDPLNQADPTADFNVPMAATLSAGANVFNSGLTMSGAPIPAPVPSYIDNPVPPPNPNPPPAGDRDGSVYTPIPTSSDSASFSSYSSANTFTSTSSTDPRIAPDGKHTKGGRVLGWYDYAQLKKDPNYIPPEAQPPSSPPSTAPSVTVESQVNSVPPVPPVAQTPAPGLITAPPIAPNLVARPVPLSTAPNLVARPVPLQRAYDPSQLILKQTTDSNYVPLAQQDQGAGAAAGAQDQPAQPPLSGVAPQVQPAPVPPSLVGSTSSNPVIVDTEPKKKNNKRQMKKK